MKIKSTIPALVFTWTCLIGLSLQGHSSGFNPELFNTQDTFALDAGVVSIQALPAYQGTHPVSLNLKNFGLDTLFSATIHWMVNGVAQPDLTWADTLLFDSVAGPLTMGNYPFGAGSYTITAWVTAPNNGLDLYPGNDSLTVTHSFLFAASIPYCESFETTSFYWTQPTTDQFDWTRTNVPTPSNSTGPDVAYQGSYFMYTEANNLVQGNAAYLQLPVDFTGITQPTLSFAYHMYGTGIGSLHLDVFDTTWHNSVWSVSGNIGNAWNTTVQNLSAYGNFGVVILRFRGIIGTNTQNRSDIGLDQICLSQLYANDAQVTTLLNTSALACPQAGVPIDIILKNNGFSPISSVPVKVRVTNPLSVTTEFADTLAGPLAAGLSDTLFPAEYDFTLPGAYTIKAFPELPGEMNPLNDTLTSSLFIYAPISSLPFGEGFETGNNHFRLQGSSLASATVIAESGSQVIRFTGGNQNTGWTGTGTTTTATNAWTQNGTHHGFAYSCQVNGAGAAYLRLKLDLKQTSPAGNYKNNWFRVLVNGTTQLTDMDGVSDFNPGAVQQYQTKSFDLSPWAGTNFTLTLQAAVRYSSTYSATYPGGDNVYVDNIQVFIPNDNDMEVEAMAQPALVSCAASSLPLNLVIHNSGLLTQDSIPVTATITNPQGTTSILSATFFDSIPSNSSDTLNMGNIQALLPGDYAVTAIAALPGDMNHGNDTLHTTFRIVIPVNSYPFLEDFVVGTHHFYYADSLYSTTELFNESGNQVLHFTGGNMNQGWTGGGTTTTATNAWTQNVTHHAYAHTCSVDATGLPGLTLKLDLKQISPTGNYMNNWFRVLVNGTTPLTDVNGVSNFNPSAATTTYTTKEFNLNAYAGTIFTLTLQAAVRYNSSYSTTYAGGDNVYIDNLRLVVPDTTDIQALSMVTPTTNLCSQTSQQVSLILRNKGLNSQDSIPVTAVVTLPGGSQVNLTALYPDTLAPGVSDTLVVGSFPSMLPGLYSVQVYANLPGDQNHSNDTLTAGFTVQGTISSFPFTEDFEGANLYFGFTGSTYASGSVGLDGATNHTMYFTGGNQNAGWTGTSTNTTATNAWVNNTTHHAYGRTCQVDASGLSGLRLGFDLKQVSPANYLLYNWIRVLVNDTVQLTDVDGVTNYTPDGTGTYSHKEFDLSAYAGTAFKLTIQACVKYNASYSTTYAGGDNAYLDNLSLWVPPPYDLQMTGFSELPVASCALGTVPLTVGFQQTGIGTLTAGSVVGLHYRLNGGTIVNETFILAQDLLPWDTLSYTFTATADLSMVQTHVVQAWLSFTGDLNASNDSTQVALVHSPEIAAFPYAQDFETVTTGWLSQTVQGTISWALGTPAHTQINTAHAGTKAYMTTLTGNYPLNTELLLYTPCFDLTAMDNPRIRFWQRFITENNYDGMILEGSADGITWTKVGGTTPGFYNSNNMQATGYPFTAPWWSGNNNTWNQYSALVTEFAGQSGVRFRFHFLSDDAITNEGMAIDDFRVENALGVSITAPLPICDGNSAELSANGLGGTPPYTYLWAPATNLSDPTLPNPIADPPSTTTYSLTVTDAAGLAFSSSITLVVNANPVINLGSDTSFCEGGYVILNAGTGNSFIWSNGEQTQEIEANAAGSYQVTLTDANGCVGISNSLLISLLPSPVVDLGADIVWTSPTGNSVTLNAGNLGDTYLWSTGDTTRTITVTTEGSFAVTVTNANGCSTTDEISITIVNAIPGQADNQGIRLSPNPARHFVQLETDQALEKGASFVLTDQTGRIIQRIDPGTGQKIWVLDIETLPAGSYHLLLPLTTGMRSVPLIKQ